jgi:hypothetical protein
MNGATHEYFFSKYNGDCMDYVEEVAKFITSHTKQYNSIDNRLAQKDFIHPNPVEKMVYFKEQTGKITIFDLSGKQVFTDTFTSGQMNLSALKQGIYIIRVQSGNAIWSSKLVKQ